MGDRYCAKMFVLWCVFVSAPCPAQTDSSPNIQVFQNPSGQVIASVSGQVGSCGLTSAEDGSDPTFTMQGTTITVTQNVVSVTCANPPPADKYYIAAVNFGRLFDGNYTINWNFPPLTTTYQVVGNPGISAAFTGNWYDSAQNGHGFELEVLPANQLLAFWFVFAPDGGQTWIGGTGPITGNQAVLQAFQINGSGGLFPPKFIPADVQSQPWGTLTFTFSDCNTGQASWSSTVAGYGSGTLPISRVTMPAGLSCP